MAPTALFRADAAPGIGGGHVQRCLALAEAMAAAGWRCGFAFRAGTRETVPALAASGHRLLQLAGAEEDEAAEIEPLLARGCDLLVVDHYGRGAHFEARCRDFAALVLAIEDRPGRAHDCDFLLDPTPGRSTAAYDGRVPAACRLLLGPGYVLLRRQFAQARAAALARREAGGAVSRLLVSVGMTDPGNITGTVLQGVAESGLALAADVVLGSAAPHLGEVRRMAATMRAHVHVDARDMAALMRGADLAVGACGSTVFERCCLGLPGVAIVTAENQRDLANAFREANVAMVVEGDDVTPQWIAGALARLCADDGARAAMARAGAALCDGEGARRVTEALGEQEKRP